MVLFDDLEGAARGRFENGDVDKPSAGTRESFFTSSGCMHLRKSSHSIPLFSIYRCVQLWPDGCLNTFRSSSFNCLFSEMAFLCAVVLKTFEFLLSVQAAVNL